MAGDTIERARGRWREILPQRGIETRYLTNKHGPCPLCGGRDRFRFDDKDGSGSYYCHQCGAGVGVILLRKLHGWDFKTAAAAIDAIIGREPPPQRSRPSPAKNKPRSDEVDADKGRRLARIKRTLAEATDDRVVATSFASAA